MYNSIVGLSDPTLLRDNIVTIIIVTFYNPIAGGEFSRLTERGRSRASNISPHAAAV